jgi:hypothetical protein
MASPFPPDAFPHGSIHPFHPDLNNPFDPLHNLPSLESPRFLPGVICAVKTCSYLAYLHPFCAACCKRKFKVQVKRTTISPDGLGLFATSTMEGKCVSSRTTTAQLHAVPEDQHIINFCTHAEYIDENDCTPFRQHGSHFRSHPVPR